MSRWVVHLSYKSHSKCLSLPFDLYTAMHHIRRSYTYARLQPRLCIARRPSSRFISSYPDGKAPLIRLDAESPVVSFPSAAPSSSESPSSESYESIRRRRTGDAWSRFVMAPDIPSAPQRIPDPSYPATSSARSASRSSEDTVDVELMDALGDTGRAMAMDRGEGDRDGRFPISFVVERTSFRGPLTIASRRGRRTSRWAC